MPDQIGSLAEDPRLRLGHLALKVGVADVEVRVRDHEDRPLALGRERHLEIAIAAGLHAQPSLRGARPLGHVKVNQLPAEVVRRREIRRVALTVQLELDAPLRHLLVEPHDGLDRFRQTSSCQTGSRLPVEDRGGGGGSNLGGRKFSDSVPSQTQGVVENPRDANARRPVGTFRRGRIIDGGQDEFVVALLEITGRKVDVKLLERILGHEGGSRIAEVIG